MRRLMMATVSLFLFALSSCSNSSSEPEATPPAVTEYVTTEELLDKIEAYTPPPQPAEEYAPVTDGNGLPLELVNRLGEAVDRDQGDAVVADLNDESLMITKDKFLELGDGPDHQLSDYLLHRNLSDHLFYRCDTDGDGEDEIFCSADISGFGRENHHVCKVGRLLCSRRLSGDRCCEAMRGVSVSGKLLCGGQL